MTVLDAKSLLVATHNAGKLEELRALLGARGIAIISSADLGLPEPEETEDTFLGNARIKAHTTARLGKMVAMADDSGLEVEALGGRPGVYTADWAETGSGRDFGHAMRRTHSELLAQSAPTPWRARFRCTLVLAWPDGRERVYDGAVDGSLVWPIRGAEGHGYDPMFVPDGEELTFAEMTPEHKNRLSHRARALEKLLADCFT